MAERRFNGGGCGIVTRLARFVKTCAVLHKLNFARKGRPLRWPFLIPGYRFSTMFGFRFVTNKQLLTTLTGLERKVMSQVERLSRAVEEQTAAINDMQARVAEDVQTLRDELQDALTEKPELNDVLARIEANTAAVGGIDPVVQEVVESGEVSDSTEDTGGEVFPTDVPPQEGPVEGVPSEDTPPAPGEVVTPTSEESAPGAPGEPVDDNR